MLVLIYHTIYNKDCFDLLVLIFIIILTGICNTLISWDSLYFKYVATIQSILTLTFIILGYLHYHNNILYFTTKLIGMELTAKKILSLYYKTKNSNYLFSIMIQLSMAALICSTQCLWVQISAALYTLYCFIIALLVKKFLEWEKFGLGIFCLGLEFAGLVCGVWLYYYVKFGGEWRVVEVNGRVEVMVVGFYGVGVVMLCWCGVCFCWARKYFYGRMGRICGKIVGKNKDRGMLQSWASEDILQKISDAN
jgi:hypothetical protein